MGLFGSTPQLLADGAIYAKVRELIVKAEKRLLIISPYIDPTGDFVRQLEEASLSREVEVQVVFRKDKLSEYRGTDWFRRLEAAGVTLAVIERLHSKVYRNESAAIVTSMNFFSSSGENSFEVGIFFEDDHKLAGQLEDYLTSLGRHMEDVVRARGSKRKQEAHGSHKGGSARVRAQVADGHCIRCDESISFNPKRPYCADDHENWARYENADYPDKYCHRCGSPHPATMRKPLCRDCFEETR
ncbi:phospholipase D-like domain-containing protein [Archangium violaceum]|uniref:phospholipase D-like domain-containing protein n=1 Tax=Archangium violaceum TaxID=83451 RepID=UPI002B298B8D|nr:phospholipase D-like domain-containing protein [Archangium gephyra]